MTPKRDCALGRRDASGKIERGPITQSTLDALLVIYIVHRSEA